MSAENKAQLNKAAGFAEIPKDPIDRVKCMEEIFEKASDMVNSENIEELCSYDSSVKRLEEYYAGPLWKEDFAADEAGAFPTYLKRGVLSEDGIYNLLESIKELKEEHKTVSKRRNRRRAKGKYGKRKTVSK